MIEIKNEQHCNGIACALELAKVEQGQDSVDVVQADDCIIVSAVNKTGKTLAFWEVRDNGEVRTPPWRAP